ncbi:DUF1697 domain-containing protein [Neobacillus dielmonensis]|uniref:DUF1697 domain-containing protein n=1 Tax=Neobacillus dielmonensis TaxID=1347369 RepID=UPI0005AABB2C|nr:DUF1697 domain-containing protein [Neobacillus dielmonensis]
MTIYIALLRGINVGGHHIIKMAELKQLLEELGLQKVKTYIQSGNVLFESNRDAELLRQSMEKQIQEAFGFPVPVVLRTQADLEQMISNCPFPTEELKEGESVQIAFLAGEPSQDGIDQLVAFSNEMEQVHINGKDVYLFFRHSIRNSKLAAQLPKLEVSATVRNWKTVIKLASLANAL